MDYLQLKSIKSMKIYSPGDNETIDLLKNYLYFNDIENMTEYGEHRLYESSTKYPEAPNYIIDKITYFNVESNASKTYYLDSSLCLNKEKLVVAVLLRMPGCLPEDSLRKYSMKITVCPNFIENEHTSFIYRLLRKKNTVKCHQHYDGYTIYVDSMDKFPLY